MTMRQIVPEEPIVLPPDPSSAVPPADSITHHAVQPVHMQCCTACSVLALMPHNELAVLYRLLSASSYSAQ